MKVIYETLPSRRIECIATVGVFDGIHLGHRFIISKIKKECQHKKLASLVITFDHPPELFLKKPFSGYITNLKEKERLMSNSGIDYLWVLKTGPSVLKLTGEEFIAHILKYFKVTKFIVGEDFRFGYRGRHDIYYLEHLAQKYEFDLSVVKKRKKSGFVMSSSIIRHLIQKGDFKEAERLLGRKYIVHGNVIKGIGIGKKIGFPTINFSPAKHVLPAPGVYAGYVRVAKKSYCAAINIGIRPTVSKSKRVVAEAHIINLKKKLATKTITVGFLGKVRKEKKFSSLKGLQRAIKNDIKTIRKRYCIPS
ncbi:MAG: bifunctional riboflavin kinase/FAD synthetase [Candidatus Omnitrophota bacterium]|nr:MAG: bifunctional riboflavin kinase/FAD synthetase [Candidatus Omnitrophota bacterium]